MEWMSIVQIAHCSQSELLKEIAGVMEANNGMIQSRSIPGDIRIIVEGTGVRSMHPVQKESA